MKSAIYVSSALLIGVIACVSVWFFLGEQKVKELHRQRLPVSSNNGITADNRNASQEKENEESLVYYERVAQRIKSNLMARYSEKQLADPETQKRLAVYDSQEYLEFLKGILATELTHRKWNDFWESQGFSVPREHTKIFRNSFPTGEPEDYEPEMRLEFARLFIAQEPVDLTNPLAAAGQRGRVIHEVFRKLDANMAWYLGQFGDDWDTAVHIKREGEPRSLAREWLTDVQRNAASIVAAAEQTRVDALEASAPSWDMSSVMESPSVSSDATTEESPSVSLPAMDALEPPAIPKRETDAAITPVPELTDPPEAPTNLPTVEGLEISLKEQFSSERLERAMSTLERYGPEEGLRRLRENDPEVANQIERHRNRSRSEDSDKSEEEVSQ